MSELRIQFTTRSAVVNNEDDQPLPLYVNLSFPERGLYTDPVPFVLPLDDKDLSEIRWYLELFSAWPSGPDYDRAERIKQQLKVWGAIFGVVCHP